MYIHETPLQISHRNPAAMLDGFAFQKNAPSKMMVPHSNSNAAQWAAALGKAGHWRTSVPVRINLVCHPFELARLPVQYVDFVLIIKSMCDGEFAPVR